MAGEVVGEYQERLVSQEAFVTILWPGAGDENNRRERSCSLRNSEGCRQRDVLNFVVIGDVVFTIWIRPRRNLRTLQFEFGLILDALQNERQRSSALRPLAIDGRLIGSDGSFEGASNRFGFNL